MNRFPTIFPAHAGVLRGAILGALLLAAPAEARFAHLPAVRMAAAATSVPVAALSGHVVPEEPEITIRVGTDRRGLDDIHGGPLAPVMTDDGVLFRLQARGADRVALAAAFTGWQPRPMTRRRGGVWEIRVPLPSGSAAYLFLVDGLWIRDPDNPVSTDADPDRAGGLDEASLLTVRHGQVVMPLALGASEVSFGVRVSYSRVDAVGAYGTVRYENRPRLHPDISLLAGYSFGRDRGLYEVGLTQPFFGPRVFDLGGTVYRRTDTRDEHRIGATENSLTTFFARQDWRDWFEAEGTSLFATLYAGPVGTLTAEWRREDNWTVEKTTDWGLFYPNKVMRDNPAVDEGELDSFGLLLVRDSRNEPDNPTRGGWLTAGWEWFGGDLGGDYEFQRGTADVRRYITVSPGYWLDFRLSGGTIRDAVRGEGDEELRGFEAVPFQERLFVGGIGTMRATVFKSLQGDRMFLGNAEIRVELVRDVQLALFVDAGDAWIAADSDLDLKVDGGIGLQDADSNLRLNLATKLDGRGGSVIFSGRIQRMF